MSSLGNFSNLPPEILTYLLSYSDNKSLLFVSKKIQQAFINDDPLFMKYKTNELNFLSNCFLNFLLISLKLTEKSILSISIIHPQWQDNQLHDGSYKTLSNWIQINLLDDPYSRRLHKELAFSVGFPKLQHQVNIPILQDDAKLKEFEFLLDLLHNELSLDEVERLLYSFRFVSHSLKEFVSLPAFTSLVKIIIKSNLTTFNTLSFTLLRNNNFSIGRSTEEILTNNVTLTQSEIDSILPFTSSTLAEQKALHFYQELFTSSTQQYSQNTNSWEERESSFVINNIRKGTTLEEHLSNYIKAITNSKSIYDDYFLTFDFAKFMKLYVGNTKSSEGEACRELVSNLVAAINK